MRAINALGAIALLGVAAAAPAAAVREDEDEGKTDDLLKGPDGIPDRVSLEADSPYYFPHWKHLGVRFNGGESSSVVEFCVSEGWCRNQVFHGGRAKKERGKFVTVTRRGTIEPYWRSRP